MSCKRCYCLLVVVVIVMFCNFIQVMRFPVGSTEPDLILGSKFVPGDDSKHFCKPTDVAVLSTGEFFVSDGFVCLPCFTLCCCVNFTYYVIILDHELVIVQCLVL